MSTYLSEIVAAHRRVAAADRRDLDALVARALDAPAPAPFAGALHAANERLGQGPGSAGLAVIAEVKRRSPSRGELAPDLDPAEVAAAYAAGGASCLSVLTDRDYFGGSPDDLVLARRAAGVPVLRKDFTVSPADVCDTRLMGADAVLLIVAALSDGELGEFAGLARRLDLDVLVEVHDEAELERALALGTRLVGVNQRDLATFAVDSSRAERVAASIPPDVVAVAESGIAGPDDARRLAAAGYRAVLVGEHAVTASDRAAAVAALCGHPVAGRARRRPDGRRPDGRRPDGRRPDGSGPDGSGPEPVGAAGPSVGR
jgi:indole-3-glycerol phosphate synthase